MSAPVVTAAPMRVLVLAGRRRAGADPLGGARPKALVEVDGVPMLERVVACLREAQGDPPVFVSCDDPALLAATPRLAALAAQGALRHHPSGTSPAASVFDFLRRHGSTAPTLVTTADHALLMPTMVRYFCTAAAAAGADLAAAVVEESVLRERYPDSRRTFIALRGGAITGANLFLFRTPESAAAARFWTRAEAVRKQPWKLAALFGPVTLARFAAHRLDLDEAAERVSAAMDLRVAAVRMPFAECAIDVDTPADLALSQDILVARRTAQR